MITDTLYVSSYLPHMAVNTSSEADRGKIILIAPDCRPPLNFFITMHTQAFIEEMKQQLLEERKTLSGEVEESANFPDYGRSEEENATEVADYQALAATNTAVTERLEEINAALERIEKQTYGVTEDGEVIPEGRLRANPAATTLVAK